MAWISRRSFLSAGAATLVLRGSEGKMRWALLSDTHLPRNPADEYRGFKPYENLQAVAKQVAGANVEGALICGDLARLQGLPGDYAALKQLLDPVTGKMPTALALGNHDDRKNFLAAFGTAAGAQPVSGKHVVVVEGPVVRFIVLDSLMDPSVVPGLLGTAQREWLVRFLAEAPVRPTLIFVHHTLNDSDGSLLDAPRLFEAIRGHRSVKGIIYGHSHAWNLESRDGMHLLNIPAVGYNFNDKEPVGWVECELTAEGGKFTLHAFAGNRGEDGKTLSLEWRPR